MRQHLLLVFAPFERGTGGLDQFLHRGRASARGRLVGRDDQALDGVQLVNRPQRRDRDDGRAVRVRDDPGMIRHRFRIDLRHDERDRLVHAEGRGVVDHHSALRHRDGPELLRRGATRREERQVHAIERLLGELRDRHRLAGKRQLLARRTRRCERANFRVGKLALLDTGQDFDADSTGRADDGDDWLGGQAGGAQRTYTLNSGFDE